MVPIIKFNILVITVMLVQFTSCVELDLVDCGVDHEMEVTVGEVELTQYPWIGILYYSYYADGGEIRAVTTVALIQSEFVIANAADIGPMPKTNFRKKSRVLLGQDWPAVGRRVRNYVLHPEYGETHNTVALVQLKEPVRNVKIKPLCPAPEMLRNPIFYVVKFHEDYNYLKKEVIPVSHVPSALCREFYMKANLYSKKMRPPHVACAVSLDEDNPCVWDAGAALVTRDVWGRWLLLGVGARGPGCGAPSRFLDLGSYAPWVRHSLNRFQRITISKINKQKYVLRSDGGNSGVPSLYQRFGACDPEEKTNCVFRESIILKTDNKQYQFLTYNMTIRDSVEYSCLTLELVNASAGSEMRITHYCPKSENQPCYYYRSSVFAISVFIMFTDTCSFELYAWGHHKTMVLLDKQLWKWEEGTYYEDFSTQRDDYRGQTYMTEYGFEPLDKKMWVPEYDLWTTTAFQRTGATKPTTPLPPKYDVPDNKTTSAPETLPITTTESTSTTAMRTKKTFKRKTTTTLSTSTTTPTTTTPTTTTTGSTSSTTTTTEASFL